MQELDAVAGSRYDRDCVKALGVVMAPKERQSRMNQKEPQVVRRRDHAWCPVGLPRIEGAGTMLPSR
jgi:hypothetical protein